MQGKNRSWVYLIEPFLIEVRKGMGFTSARIFYNHDNFVYVTLRLPDITVQNRIDVYKFMMIAFQILSRIILLMYYYTIHLKRFNNY